MKLLLILLLSNVASIGVYAETDGKSTFVQPLQPVTTNGARRRR